MMPCQKNMRGCKTSCAHRQLVRDYHLSRAAYVAERERVCLGYPTETREYDEQMNGRAILFKHWLIWNRRPAEMAAS
jgi:hypothetical protein